MKTDLQRARLIKLIHVARRELNMDESSYRLMLSNTPILEGVTSTAELTVPKLNLVLELLKKKGFKVVPKIKGNKSPQKLAGDAQSRLIRHLWLTLHSGGAVRDSSETALEAFVQNRTGVAKLQWLSSAQARNIIEHLKKWLARYGENV